MWIFTKVDVSQRSKDMGNFMFKFHSMTEAINKMWDFFFGTHKWMQKSFKEIQESKSMWFLQDDIEVPCMMQWKLVWYSAQSHLNRFLIRIGALRDCCDKAIIKAMETVLATPLGKDTRRGQSAWNRGR